MDNILMRRIISEDVPALSVMAKQTFYDTFTGTCTEYDMEEFLEYYYNEPTLEKQLEEGIDYFFAEINGEPVGYLSFKDEQPDFEEIKGSSALELKRFYVNKEFHGTAVAHDMMQFLTDHAQSQGYDNIFLGVWEFNFRAQKFYTKYGFMLTGHRHDFPIGNTPQTDVYMIKFLNRP